MKTNISKSVQTVWTGVVLTVCMFAGASAISSNTPVLLPSAQAGSVSHSGPADVQVALQYGRIDHSSLMSPGILAAPNPAPAAVAAYETPPQ